MAGGVASATAGRFGGVPVRFLCLVAAVEAGVLAYGFLPEDHSRRAAYFVGLQLAMMVPALAAVYWRREEPLGFGWILAAAALVRLSCLPSDLIFENDVFRYLWDGRVSAAGVNPYRFAPADPALARFADDWVFPQIPYRQIPTVYPPFAEVLFLGSRALFGEDVLGLRLVMTAFDLGTVVAVHRLGQALGAPRAAAAYALHPLAIHSFSQAAHVDAAAVCCLAWGAVLLVHDRTLWACAAIAAATQFKVFPVVVVPVLARRAGVKGVAVYASIALLPFAAVAATGVNPFVGLSAFARYWIFNPSIYDLAVRAIALVHPLEVAHTWARPACGVAALATILAVAVRTDTKDVRRVLVGMVASVFALLAFSPAANSWYVAWLLPLSIVLGWAPGVAWTATVFLAYTFFVRGTDEPLYRLAEYLPVVVALGWLLFRGRRRLSRLTPLETGP